MTTRQKKQPGLTRPVFAMVPAELLAECKSRKGTVFVWGNLWLHASGSPEERGRAFPSVETQAKECGMDAKDIREARRWLEEQGWLQRTDRPGLTPMFQVLLEPRKPAKRKPTPRGNAPGVKHPRGPLGETPQGTPGADAPPNKNPLTRTIDQEVEPLCVSPSAEAQRRPPAVATHPCHDGGVTSDQDQGQQPWPEPEAAPIRDRDGFLINPLAPPPPITAAAAAAPAAAPEPDPLPLIEPEVWPATQADPLPEAPAATQPQPQQPNAPRPLPTPADPEPIAPVNPKGTSRKGGFQPVEGDVPAALLPCVRELLVFWASKGGKRTERAWTAQLGQLQRIQDDPAGGTEAVRGQLEAGAQAAVFGKPWMAVTHANWERYGRRVTPIIGSGFNRPPNAMEVAVRAMAAIRRREEEARAEAAEMAREDERLLAGVA